MKKTDESIPSTIWAGAGRPLLRLGAVAALAATWASAAAAAPAREWTEISTLTHAHGNLTFCAPWTPQQSMTLRFSDAADDAKTARIMIEEGQARLELSPEDAFTELVRDRGRRWHGQATLPEPLDCATWTLKRRNLNWTLHVEETPLLSFPAPFPGSVKVARPQDQGPAEGEETRRPRFQRIGAVNFADNFFLPGDTDDPLIEWEKVSGQWELRTAADAITERGDRIRRRRGRAPDPERSANFSSLRGQGENALLLAGHDFFDTYTLEASTLTAPGEAGLVFYHAEDGAHYGLTLAMHEEGPKALLRLWHVADPEEGERETLAAVVTEMTLDQWVQLRVETHPRRIVGFLDNTRIADVALDLPPGGRFGLFAHSEAGMLFDDVRAYSNPHLSLGSLQEMRRQQLAAQGEFFPKDGRFLRKGAAPDPAVLTVAPARMDQWLAIGEPDHDGHVFSARFDELPTSSRVGLMGGYRNAQAPHWRFTRNRTPNEETLLLEEVVGDTAAVVEELRLARNEETAAKSGCTLMLDATQAGELRLYRDGELMLIHHPPEPLQGGSGLFVGAGSSARISQPRYAFEREDLHHDKFEESELFRDDPFMRNWASPEGEWAQDAEGRTWHKGDFYGRFSARMPLVDNTEVHIGVPDGSRTGRYAMRASDGTLRLVKGDRPDDPPLASIPVDSLAETPDEQGKETFPHYDIHYEGYWLWVTSGETLRIKHRLDTPLAGRRMRIDGFSLDDLKHSRVRRYNVKDHLFNESLHAWVQNGGIWEVLNRFSCDPRWSHMGGENPAGLAALWSKHELQGDFCIEMYAGMRHHFYQRAGDLNLTVMSDPATPSRGYSLTCTGWDPDHSQLYTRLYRHGVEQAETDQYLVPRHREGQRRRIRDPLIRAGRDLHGAWYYIKLRRVGNRLEFHFDNELVFAWEDDDPVPAGRVGVWTFNNSMMVARVKMAAEHIVPHKQPFEPAPLDMTRADLAAPGPGPEWERRRALVKNERPAEALLPEHWHADDETGRTRLAWSNPEQGRPQFTATTTLGGGEMFTRATWPLVRHEDLAGWTFQIKRTAQAQFNFHYALGTVNEKGEFERKARLFHQISGDDFSQGDFLRTGSTTAPGDTAPGENWTESEPWTDITVWAPTRAEAGLAGEQDLWVRVEGFGNKQPSRILQGLHGNGPGEAYAVRAFSEIRTHPPKIEGTLPESGLAVADISTVRPRPDAPGANREALQTAIHSVTNSGLVRLALEDPEQNGAILHDWRWIRAPALSDLKLAAQWHPEKAETVRIEHMADWPDRRFQSAALRIAGATLDTWQEGIGALAALVPRQAALGSDTVDTVPVELQIGDETFAFDLPWADLAVAAPPALQKIGGSIEFFEGFETRSFPDTLAQAPDRMRIETLDPEQGSFLRVFNPGRQQRLNFLFRHPVHLARHPLLQFQYRAPPMARISLTLADNRAVRISENFGDARTVRNAEPAILDHSWRTWFGRIDDTMQGEHPLHHDPLRADRFRFGSRHSIDQTGLFTELDMDDLVWGPAVSEHRPLEIEPEYFSFHGVESVYMAVQPGSVPFGELDSEQQAQVDWRPLSNGGTGRPQTGDLSDGVHRLLLKARDRQGRESPVTDVPFLLDTAPPHVSQTVAESDDILHNASVLRLSLDTGAGSPPDLSGVALKWNGRPVEPEPLGSLYKHAPEQGEWTLNWPYIFRDQIQELEDGDTFEISLTGLRDGAGNPAETATFALSMDFDQDETPPTILPVDYPDNVFWQISWESPARADPRFESSETLELQRPSNETPYLRHTTPRNRGIGAFSATPPGRNNVWRVADHPLVAFELRRPSIDDGRRSGNLTLVLERNGADDIHIALAGDDPRMTTRPLPKPVEWQENTWHAITLDLHALVGAELSESQWKEITVDKVHFRVHQGRQTQTHLRSFFVFSEWGIEDTVHLRAFDASGIDTAVWRVEDTLNAVSAAPGAGLQSDRLNRWAAVHIRDRAGNETYSWNIPLGRGSRPALHLEE